MPRPLYPRKRLALLFSQPAIASKARRFVSSVDSLSGRWAKTHASRDETLRSRDRSLLAKITGEHIIDVDRRHHRYSLGASDRPRKAESLPAAASHLAAARFWPTSSRSLPTETVDMSALSTPSICGNNGRGHSKCSSSFIPRWSVLTITAETWRDQFGRIEITGN